MAITRILVANRGEIARRVFRTCRAMGIETVAVFTTPEAAEPFVGEADMAVPLHGPDPRSCYLDTDQVLAAARTTGADAIHPGYGFLSESPAFATAVVEAELIWIGPPPKAIEVMGSKIASKRLMTDIGVPVIESRELEGADVSKLADGLGYPVLVKASAGGGGRGMRVVETPDALEAAIESAKREAAASFGDETVFLERYLPAPRHIEVQVFADTNGNVVSMFERECSIQRRHQKIIEESPSPAVGPELRERMGQAAVAAARSVSYLGAGTVEFLVEDDDFYFLEMNTRLQVEHPVTEMVTGLDLVRLQIEVADGLPLPPEALDPQVEGHAIEARLYAEDPANDFLPVIGTVHAFDFADLPGLRVDSGVAAGSEVTIDFDPMLAKVVAHGGTREDAIETLARALRSARIHTGANNLPLLVRILESEEFRHGETDTGFLTRHDPVDWSEPLLDPAGERAAALAVVLADRDYRRSTAAVQAGIPAGWRNSPGPPQTVAMTGPRGEHRFEYGGAGRQVEIVGAGSLVLIETGPHRVEMELDGVDYGFDVARYGEARFCDSPDGGVIFELSGRFPRSRIDEAAGSLRAPMPGRVIRVEVRPGDAVAAGDALVVLEAMKMEHTLRSPHDGEVVDVLCRSGDQVEGAAVLVVVGESPST